MKYLSICSGIEAATVAWHGLGWKPIAFSEIEPFPRAVLQHHYPDIPLNGDFTRLRDEPWIGDADLLVGGTPCQDFSIAGLRQSLAGGRGNLTLEFIRLADATDNLRCSSGREPAHILWENVPGVLSVKDNAFGTFLAGLCGCGAPLVSPNEYGWSDAGVVAGPKRVAAWRVLDAQYFGLAQRRRRVFVLARGGSGGWRCADALLPIIESLRGNPPPRREARKDVAPTLSARTKGGGGLGTDFDCDGGLIAHTLNAHPGGRYDYETETLAAHSLRGGGFDASEDGAGRGTPLVPVMSVHDVAGTLGTRSADHPSGVKSESEFIIGVQGVALRGRDEGGTAELTGDVMTALRCGGGGGDKPHVLTPTIAYRTTGNDGAYETGDCAPCLNTATDPNQITLLQRWRVRRLLPSECEKLQGFPVGYTAVPYRGKEAADGPRYKSLGNSMAVNVMRWIGRRIQMVEDATRGLP